MKIIMHNSVSLDSSMKELKVDLATHYELVEKFDVDVYMFGSVTAVAAIQEGLAEVEVDIEKVKKDKPYWVIIDSKGKLENLLHIYRKSPYAGNIIVLVSKKTPKSYLKYLTDNDYDYIVTGEDFVDYKQALQILEEDYSVKSILIDSGGLLNSYFFEHSLIDEISLIIQPFILGKECINVFRYIKTPLNLSLVKCERIKELVWLIYKIKK